MRHAPSVSRNRGSQGKQALADQMCVKQRWQSWHKTVKPAMTIEGDEGWSCMHFCLNTTALVSFQQHAREVLGSMQVFA